jgi:hypothetical protein
MLTFSLTISLRCPIHLLPYQKEKKAEPSGRALMSPQQKKDADTAAMKIKNDARDAAKAAGGAPSASGAPTGGKR